MQNNIKTKRRGLTLIEMMVVITGITGIILISTRCCFHVLHEGTAAQDFSDHHQQWLQLSEAFRRDVHSADSATIAGDGSELDLKFETGRTIRYRRDQDYVERTESSATKKPPANRFRLWDGMTKWSLAENGRLAVLTCDWHSVAAAPAIAAGQSPPARELKLEVAVGSDHRFSSTTNSP